MPVTVTTPDDLAALAARVTALEAAKLVPIPPAPPTPADLAGTTFLDHFEGSSVDYSKWSAAFDYAVQGNASAGDGLESFAINPVFPATSAASLNPFSVGGGVLTMQIKPIPPQFAGVTAGRKYGAGLLVTQNRFSQLYGYFEARMTAHRVFGTCSAFWLLPADGTWPPELDVIEVKGAQPTLGIYTSHSATGGNAASPPWSTIADAGAGMHTYGLNWTADRLTWYVDRVAVASGPTPADCDKAMFIVASNYAGAANAWFGGPIAAGTPMPQSMAVDYVAAWATRPF